MDNIITRAEHEEFRRRMEEHNKRQDKRIELVEATLDEMRKLTLSVQKLALNGEAMCLELKEHGERISKIEEQEGETWRKLKGYLLTAAASAVVGALSRGL